MSEDGKAAVDTVIERIHYLLLTGPDKLEFNSREKSLLHHLHEHFGGSWGRFVANVENQKELYPDKRRDYELSLHHISWLRAYEQRHNVSLIEMYLAGATRTS